MRLTSMRDGTTQRAVDGYFARAILPVRLSPEDARRAFADPLSSGLAEAGLGRLVAHEVATDAEGEPAELTLVLSLRGDGPDVLQAVARLLDGLGAPTGSVLGNAECADLVRFGTKEGLGLYLHRSDLGPSDDAHREVVRACQRALKGAGLFQGAFSTADRTALYFYGSSFQRMQSAITYVMSTNPKCRNAFARRLN